jgi:hypothetical protein
VLADIAVTVELADPSSKILALIRRNLNYYQGE